jgi:hypothetical protein
MSRHRVGRAGAASGRDHPCRMSADRVGERRSDFAPSPPPAHTSLGKAPWQNADAVTQSRRDSSAPTRFADMPDWGRASGFVPKAPPPHRGAPPADQPCSGGTVAVADRHQHDLRHDQRRLQKWLGTRRPGASSRRADRRPTIHQRHGGCGQLAPTRFADMADSERRSGSAPGSLPPHRKAALADQPFTGTSIAGMAETTPEVIQTNIAPPVDMHLPSDLRSQEARQLGRLVGTNAVWRHARRRPLAADRPPRCSPGQPSTTLRSASPSSQRARFSMKNRAWRSSQSATRSLMCGVISTLSNRQSGLSGGSGSLAKTSR